MADKLAGKGYGSNDSGVPFLITTNDGSDLTDVTRMLVVGVAGNIKLTDVDDVTQTYAFPAGQFPIRVKRVWATGTTASGIWGIK